jgi:hypothetical protein
MRIMRIKHNAYHAYHAYLNLLTHILMRILRITRKCLIIAYLDLMCVNCIFELFESGPRYLSWGPFIFIRTKPPIGATPVGQPGHADY